MTPTLKHRGLLQGSDNQLRTNYATLSEIYLSTIWYNMLLHTKLDVSMTTVF